MIPIRCIIVILLFTISITILIVGTTIDIQGCIIGGILSILVSAIVTMGIMMHRRTEVKTTKPRIVKPPITTLTPNISITIMPTTEAITTEMAVLPTDIKNPIYEPV